MKAMILAAGFGTRLRPVTLTLPKPLVPVCNRPLIGYAVEAFLRAGIRDIVVNLHHLPEPLERYLVARYGNEAHFEFSIEPEILGTGGGIRKVRALLESEPEFFLVNADTIQLPRYDDLLRARREHDALAALTLRHPPEGDRFTPVWRDAARVTGFGSGTGEAMMFAGSHVISSRIFRYLPDRAFSGIVEDVYQPLVQQEMLAAVVDDGPWFDIGTPQRYANAFRDVLQLTLGGTIELARGSRVDGTSIIDESARIDGHVAHSSIGARSVIEGDVADSAVWDDCHIGLGVTLRGCIVAHGVTLREPGTYERSMISGAEVIPL